MDISKTKLTSGVSRKAAYQLSSAAYKTCYKTLCLGFTSWPKFPNLLLLSYFFLCFFMSSFFLHVTSAMFLYATNVKVSGTTMVEYF